MMKKAQEIIDWMSHMKKEFGYHEMSIKFDIALEEWEDIKDILIEKNFISETKNGAFNISEQALIFIEKFKKELPEIIKHCFRANVKTEDSDLYEWSQLHEIDEFLIYPGEEKIYEVKINGKVVKMEGKEIIDYNVFILRFFEEFGVMLPKYKGVANDWGKLVTHWHKKYGKIAKEMSEHLSVSLEGREAVIDYINSCSVTDDYIVKDGMITYKNDCLYVPTRSIKKFLKRADIFITLRKLGYAMRDILLSGSIPLKIENKSERFWRLDPKSFDLDLKSSLHIEKEPEPEEEEVSDSEEVSEQDQEEPKALIPNLSEEPKALIPVEPKESISLEPKKESNVAPEQKVILDEPKTEQKSLS